MRKDSRYEMADLLDKKAKEKLFDEHIMTLDRKRRDLFYQVLILKVALLYPMAKRGEKLSGGWVVFW